MYKRLAEKFVIDESTMQKGNLRLLFWMLVGSVPLFPLFAIVESTPLVHAIGLGWLQFELPSWAVTFVGLGMLLSFACLIGLGSNKLINRLWFPNKYLDEWEIERKQASMSFAFQTVIITAIVIMTFRYIAENNGWINPVEVPFTTAMFSVVWLGSYAQAFHIVKSVVPVEQDELASSEVYDWQLEKADRPKRKRSLPVMWIVIGIFVALAVMGSVMKVPVNIKNGQQAVTNCEARGSHFTRDTYDVDWSSVTCADGTIALPELSQ